MYKTKHLFLSIFIIFILLLQNIIAVSANEAPNIKLITSPNADQVLIIDNNTLYLGDDDDTTITKISDNVTDAKFDSYTHIIILTTDNTIKQYDIETGITENILTDAKSIYTSVGYGMFSPPKFYCYAIKEDSTLWGWGKSSEAELLLDDVSFLKSCYSGSLGQNCGEFIITNSDKIYEIKQSFTENFSDIYLLTNAVDISRATLGNHSVTHPLYGQMTYQLTADGELWGSGYSEVYDDNIGDTVRTLYQSKKLADNVSKINGSYFWDNSGNLYYLEFHNVEFVCENIKSDVYEESQLWEPYIDDKKALFINNQNQIFDPDQIPHKNLNVSKLMGNFALTSNGELYTLARDEHETDSLIAKDVADFSLASDGTAYYQSNNGSIFVVYNDPRETEKRLISDIPQDIKIDEIPTKTYGDTSFNLNITDNSASLGTLTYSSSNPDIASVTDDGIVNINAAGTTDITISRKGNFYYTDFSHIQTLTVNKKDISVTAVDLVDKTYTLEGLLETDADVSLDFDKLNIEIADLTGDTETKIIFNHFILKGKNSENYTVSTKSLESAISDKDIVSVITTAKNGTVTGNGNYIKGSKVTLSAVADKGYKFSGWYDDSGDKLSSSDEYTFTAESNIEITAKFSKKTTGGSGDRGGGGGSFGGSGNSGGSTSSKKPTKEEPEEKKKDDSAKPATYSDVKTNDWFYDSVKYVSENGIMNGITEKEFAPNNNLTRAMFVTVLYRIEGSPETGMSPFGDVGSGSWYEKAVSWATENNIVNGVSETEFAPNNNITREQMAAILYRYATYKGKDVTLKGNANTLSFDDTEEISGYAISALQWAVENGLMSGESPSTINPKNNSTRAQAATVFMRMLTN